MSNFLQPSTNNHADYNNEQFIEQTDLSMRQLHIETIESQANQDQVHLERLMGTGFSWDEAIKLVGMREHVYENVEVRQRMESDPRIEFARWMIERGEMKEL